MTTQNSEFRIQNLKKEAGTGQEQGFTLIEVMIAMVVLLIGMLGVMAMQYYAIAGNSASRELKIATTLSQEMLEQLRGTPYANLALVSPGTDSPLPVGNPDPFTVAATSGGIDYQRSWWVVANCTELGANGTLCIQGGAGAPACSTNPDPAVATPASAIRARTCWTDKNGTPHSVSLDTVRWDETSVP